MNEAGHHKSSQRVRSLFDTILQFSQPWAHPVNCSMHLNSSEYFKLQLMMKLQIMTYFYDSIPFFVHTIEQQPILELLQQ